MNSEINALILQECQLLDQSKLDDWLALYARESSYWIPIDETADPMRDSSVIYDNRLRLEMRVEQIMRQNRVAQSPSSNTMRMISNLQIQAGSGDSATAQYSLLLVEVRSGDWRQQGLGETRLFPGHCDMEFCKEDGAWRIHSKKIVLLNRKQPIVGLSFII